MSSARSLPIIVANFQLYSTFRLSSYILRQVNQESFYVLHNGRKLEPNHVLEEGKVYHVVPRVLGGKGGFGSMLRAIGAQIEKTTSREACRDLSGRRMRDVNNEKQLKEWLAKEADREREREERRQERLARRLAGPKHNFDDPEYHNQKSKVQEDLDDALQKGLKRANDDQPSTSKSGPTKKMKSSKEWLGVDIDSDDLESDSDNEACPGSPGLMKDDTASTDSNAEAECSETVGAMETIDERCENDAASVENESSESIQENKDNSPSESVTTQNSANSFTEDKETPAVAVSSDEPIDLDKVDSLHELMAMGLERLKNALMSRGLKCGGTVEERAQRLLSVKGLTPEQIPSSLFAKSKGGGKKSK